MEEVADDEGRNGAEWKCVDERLSANVFEDMAAALAGRIIAGCASTALGVAGSGGAERQPEPGPDLGRQREPEPERQPERQPER